MTTENQASSPKYSETKKETIPEEILDSTLYKNFVKEFTEAESQAFFKKSEAELRAIIAECSVQETEAKQEVKDNEEYKKAKAIIKAFNGGLRDVLKPLKLKASGASTRVAYDNEVKRAK